jgi:dTDP-glucose 4,6-dehydratase
MNSRNIKKILITGRSGFIGSAVIRRFINETDITVVNVDALTYAGNLESLESVSKHPRYFFEHANICDRPHDRRMIAK